MADVMTLFARLILDTSGYDTGLEKAKKDASSAGQGITKGLSGVGKAVSGIAKASAIGIGAGATAVGFLAKQSVSAYSEYEQLSGGVKKLFGDSYKSVMDFASESYKTSGVSANQYIEQVTSFSAALINSLGGDTQKAAEQADVAMRAMSDNVNTFGTDMGSVQNAFQGFAKSNYTMLDNLKLGYSGTKSEMERLIADANEYAAANGKAADLSISSFSDIVTAIELIQEKQGIAGTTAKEAATTIEGSFNSTKAAWNNLVAGLANPDADLNKLMDNLIVAIVGDKEGTGLLNQVMPAIERALKGIGEFAVKAAPIISAKFPALIKTILPPLLTAATTLVSGLVAALPTILQVLIDQVPSIMSSLVTAFINVAPMLLGMVGQIFDMVITAVGAGIELLWNSATTALAPGIESVKEKFATIKDFLVSLWNDIVGNIVEIWNTIVSILTSFWNTIKTLVSGAINVVKTTISNGFEAVKKTILNVWNVITTFLSTTLNKIKTTVSTTWGNIKSTVGGAVENIKTKITNGFNEAKEKATSTFSDMKNAIKEKMDAVKDTIKSIIDKIKGFFPIKIGKWLSDLPKISLKTTEKTVLGKTVTIPTGFEWHAKAMQQPYMFTEPTLFGAGEVGDEFLYGRKNLMNDIRQVVYEVIGAGSGFTQNITINSPTPLNPSEIARQTRNQTRGMILRMRTA